MDNIYKRSYVYVVYLVEYFEFRGIEKVFHSKQDADDYIDSHGSQYFEDDMKLCVDKIEIR